MNAVMKRVRRRRRRKVIREKRVIWTEISLGRKEL